MSAIECYPSTSKAKECIPPSLDQVSALPYYQMNGREPPPIYIQSQDREPKFKTWVYQRPMTTSK